MLIRMIFGFVALLTLNSVCIGQITSEYTQAVSSQWNDPGNWTNGVPGPADTAVIDFELHKNQGVDLSSDVTVAKIILKDDSANVVFIRLNGNTLNVGDLEFRGSQGAGIEGNGELNITGTTTFESYGCIDCVVNNFGSFFPHPNEFSIFNEFRNMPGGIIFGGSMFGPGTVINMEGAEFCSVQSVFALNMVNFGDVVAGDWDAIGPMSSLEQFSPGTFSAGGIARVASACIEGGSLGAGTFRIAGLQLKNVDIDGVPDFFLTGASGDSNSSINFDLPGDRMVFCESFDIDLQGTINISANAGFGAGSYNLIDVNFPKGSVNFDVSLGQAPIGFAYELVVAGNNLNLVVTEPCGNSIGDINGDGSVDLLDVEPFVAAINGSYLCEADINQDGSVDLLDVEPFVELLSGN